MTEPQRVAIYSAAYDRSSGASHRLLPEPALASGEHGKPYFPDAPQLHFSISHSGERWLCAFSDAPVGLDVQQHRACQMQALARRFFAPAEQKFLEQTAYAPFFDLWCAKESYLKYTAPSRRRAAFHPSRASVCVCCRCSQAIPPASALPPRQRYAYSPCRGGRLCPPAGKAFFWKFTANPYAHTCLVVEADAHLWRLRLETSLRASHRPGRLHRLYRNLRRSRNFHHAS